jgi:hypothetical protein
VWLPRGTVDKQIGMVGSVIHSEVPGFVGHPAQPMRAQRGTIAGQTTRQSQLRVGVYKHGQA